MEIRNLLYVMGHPRGYEAHLIYHRGYLNNSRLYTFRVIANNIEDYNKLESKFQEYYVHSYHAGEMEVCYDGYTFMAYKNSVKSLGSFIPFMTSPYDHGMIARILLSPYKDKIKTHLQDYDYKEHNKIVDEYRAPYIR